MHPIARVSPLVFSLALFSCDSTSPSRPDSATILDGMVRIPAKGKETLLGSRDPFAKKNEEGSGTTVSFSYDFFMDPTEVTQSLFQSLLGRNPANAGFGLGADYPVYNVTFYDAALLCNARSRAAGLDTVYEYVGAQTNSTGRAFLLGGLVIHYERDGYRLPTEAEWEFAGRAGRTTTFPWGGVFDSAQAAGSAWYFGNSLGRTHPVRGFPANAYGLYDMLGNVMEWVNDWKQPYAAGTIGDFLGNRDPGIVQERSVKGGSFAYDERYLRYSARSANYPTLGSSAVEYIGFRCVRGAIAAGNYLSGGQVHGATPGVSLDGPKGLAFIGHNQFKLVFVNAAAATRTLCFADFAENPVTVHEFLDDSLVFVPVISPDGQWVAYGNRDEGDTRAGTVCVRRLKPGSPINTLPVPSALIPRWWSSEADTFLYYATNARDNADPAWSGDQTYAIRMSGGKAAGSPVLASGNGGFHDGLSQSGKYLVSGYKTLKVRNTGDGSIVTLFTGPQNGKPAGDTSQVCNVSLQPTGADAPDALLLDFGYRGISSRVGRSYGLHEILFRLNTASGAVGRWYGAPQGFTAWQDVEWSNHPDYAAAVGEDKSLGYPAVLAANLTDSTTAILAKGENLRQPALWIKPGVVIPSSEDRAVNDSLGRYNVLPTDFSQEMFANKMRTFWLQRGYGDVVGLGTSHLAFGMWPAAFTHFNAVNMGTAGAPMGVNVGVLKDYVLPQYQKLRAVIFDVLLGNLFFSFATPPVWNGALGHVYDRNHGYWKQAVPVYMDSLMRYTRVEATAAQYDSLGGGGYFIFHSNGWGADPPPNFIQGTGVLPDQYESENVQTLKDLAAEVGARGILFVMVIFPESPNYQRTPYYAKHGPVREAGRAIVADLENSCSLLPNCRLYDANREGNHDFTSEEFSDEDHLNQTGAAKLSLRLDSLVYGAIGPASQANKGRLISSRRYGPVLRMRPH